MACTIILPRGDGMYRSDAMNQEIADITEPYADHAERA